MSSSSQSHPAVVSIPHLFCFLASFLANLAENPETSPVSLGVGGLESFLLKKTSAVGFSGLVLMESLEPFLPSPPFPESPGVEVAVGVAGCLGAGGSRGEGQGPGQPRFGYEVWMVSPPTDLLCRRRWSQPQRS